ncbi:hypothetical protein BXT84_13230 [Sulfobacillus thermotolerans]|uniref:Uncharacterized protein n=1 Tax=Sulfobacillus thermotolerans TaxID=338644 RepID=A0ABM6RTY6_9FIRM|nr:hypothetical protein BXT84_13230 [Sulfobacillus thermotolerans]
MKKQFNAIKYLQFPWLRTIHRDAHAQPFADLAKPRLGASARQHIGDSTHPAPNSIQMPGSDFLPDRRTVRR